MNLNSRMCTISILFLGRQPNQPRIVKKRRVDGCISSLMIIKTAHSLSSFMPADYGKMFVLKIQLNLARRSYSVKPVYVVCMYIVESAQLVRTADENAYTWETTSSFGKMNETEKNPREYDDYNANFIVALQARDLWMLSSVMS